MIIASYSKSNYTHLGTGLIFISTLIGSKVITKNLLFGADNDRNPEAI
jgi:hypothetical protein